MNWLGMMLIVLGFFMITWKNRWGFLVNMAGSIAICYALWGVDWAVVALNIFFSVTCAIGFYRWRKDEKVT